MEYEKIILVTRKTRLEGLVEQFNTLSQAKFYLEHSGGDFSRYEKEHQVYQKAVKSLRTTLKPLAKVQVIERSYLPNFLFSETDLVVTVGVDGLVVNTAKYLDGQPLVAVNPDPKLIDGILLPFSVAQAPVAVQRTLRGLASTRAISMAEARLADGQSLLAFNDLFIGIRSHVSARYRIQCGEKSEQHSSSGIIVSTGAGSTGWLSSLFNMANGLYSTFGNISAPMTPPRLEWETERLIYVVREPFASKFSQANLICGLITPENPLLLQSEMSEGGVIFSDGVETDALAFNAGTNATITLAAKKTHLVVG